MITQEQIDGISRIAEYGKEMRDRRTMINELLLELDTLLKQKDTVEQKITQQREAISSYLKEKELTNYTNDFATVSFSRKTKKVVDYDKLRETNGELYFYGLVEQFDPDTAILELSNNLDLTTKDAKAIVENALRDVTTVTQLEPTMVIKMKEKGE